MHVEKNLIGGGTSNRNFSKKSLVSFEAKTACFCYTNVFPVYTPVDASIYAVC